jgi:hypothetical protein
MARAICRTDSLGNKRLSTRELTIFEVNYETALDTFELAE